MHYLWTIQTTFLNLIIIVSNISNEERTKKKKSIVTGRGEYKIAVSDRTLYKNFQHFTVYFTRSMKLWNYQPYLCTVLLAKRFKYVLVTSFFIIRINLIRIPSVLGSFCLITEKKCSFVVFNIFYNYYPSQVLIRCFTALCE